MVAVESGIMTESAGQTAAEGARPGAVGALGQILL